MAHEEGEASQTGPKAQRHECRNFARLHLRDLAAELLAWQDTALLADGKVRELARMCAAFAGDRDSLKIAEHLVEREALMYCTRGRTLEAG